MRGQTKWLKTVVDVEKLLTFRVGLANEAVMTFQVFEISLTDLNDENPEYPIKNAHSGTDTTPDLDAARVFFSGYIKWDGCTDYTFDEQDNCMMHMCGNPAELFSYAWNKIYQLANELMPGNEYYLTDKKS